jgi:uncharacterized protein
MAAPMEWPCLTSHGESVALALRVTPRAGRTEPEGLAEGRLRLRVKAPPVEGKANKEVCKWAAKAFNISPSRVRLVRGEHGRRKDLLLEGLDVASASRLLEAMLAK